MLIEPATPVLHPVPPLGADWLHEVKFDGWRVQLLDSAAAVDKGWDVCRGQQCTQ